MGTFNKGILLAFNGKVRTLLGRTCREKDVMRSLSHTSKKTASLLQKKTMGFWVALNSTFYVGGNSKANGVVKDDRSSNSRIGIAAVIPTGKLSTIKVSANTGAVVRIGQDFDSVFICWQKSWLEKPKKQ